MTNFWDLPHSVREKIYRLHLVQDKPISADEHDQLVRSCWKGIGPYKELPPLLSVSTEIEIEAAPIYYGENHFEFGEVFQAFGFANSTDKQHLRLIKEVTCSWEGILSSEGFAAIAKMKGLQKLYIRVDEASMVRWTMFRHHLQWNGQPMKEPTPQQQLSLVRHPGYNTLTKIRGIPHVEFVKETNSKDEETGGPIVGGFLETRVLPMLKSNSESIVRTGLDDDTFPFLSLPPEIRNRIYQILLCIPGNLHPSTERPSSTPKKVKNRRIHPPTPESALSVLVVNKRINNEAFGMFYHCNAFEFYYPTQLHAFLLSLGLERQKYIRDLTIHYYNRKIGGIDLAELTFPMLKQLPGLRRLHVLLGCRFSKLIVSKYHPMNGFGLGIDKANPAVLPGVKVMLSLRGVVDIKLRYTQLESEFDEAKKDQEFPQFTEGSKKACIVKLTKVLEHFNKALAAAQHGKVNKKILEDPEWHMKDVFPTINGEVKVH